MVGNFDHWRYLMSLAEKRLFLLDMDGTIYLSETLFDGTKDACF